MLSRDSIQVAPNPPPVFLVPICLTFVKDKNSQQQIYHISISSSLKLINLQAVFKKKLNMGKNSTQGLFFFQGKKLLNSQRNIGQLFEKFKNITTNKLDLNCSTVEKF